MGGMWLKVLRSVLYGLVVVLLAGIALVAGIIIADYFNHRKRLLNVEALYQTDGEYSYRHGFSLVGLGSLLVAVAPNVPGFLAAVGVVEKASLPPLLATCYNYAWFTGFGLAFILYLILRKIAPGS